MAEFRPLVEDCVSLDACFRHYLNMAGSNWRTYFTEDTARLKKYLYVLRPIFAARWIEAHRTLPPIEFSTLTEGAGEPGSVAVEIEELLARKAVTSELGEAGRLPILDRFVEAEMERLRDLKMPTRPPVAMEKLDTFFRRQVTRFSSQ
jgi:predicted nucleotidyltransferase